ncbi:rRNA methyltransferase [Bifidobacterium dolichotidis]|uniref:rRNA methyltransferase n=1 Tax=Bifidobacterium dolichotidis TaxID=2306976 RepID=A0A430FTD7_9BIFI|nr:RNA methyltransferase [Bifidobacterium dolichotidis]RSX56146.1 rRNA methyltransferase [Bifidobacterium dolichotidis]
MPMYDEVLNHANSERFKRIRSLTDHKRREKANRCVVEGPQAVRELLQWMPQAALDLYVAVDSAEPDAAFLNPTIGQLAGMGLRANCYVHKATLQVLHHVSADCQGVFAIADLRELHSATEEAMNAAMESAAHAGESDEAQTAPMVAAFWQIRDPGNAGTAIRSADAAGCACVIFVGDCVDLYNQKVIRSTTGSLFHLPVVTMSEQEFDEWRAEHNFKLMAADVYGTEDRKPQMLPTILQQRAFTHEPTCVLFGNEARGLEADMLNKADEIVSIPIYGKAESLNLATSASILLMSMAMSSRVETI